MDSKILKQLEAAKGHFYAWRMAEAYALFRRFFDRLPFQPSVEHARYLPLFIRVLAELGKLGELEFYIGELEKLHQRSADPILAYTLGVAYLNSEFRRPETA